MVRPHSHDELKTLLVEVEAVVNSRPLTCVEDDLDGITYPLTPSHLIYGRRIANTPNAGHFEVISTHDTLTKRSKHQRRLLNHFTKQWRRNYLLNLRECHLVKCRSHNKKVTSVGDVVLLRDDCAKCIFWKLAIVKELLVGHDSQVRAAAVKVADSSRLLKRSITHLIPLDLSINESKDSS